MPKNTDIAWWQEDWEPRRKYHGVKRFSKYVTMRDGIKIACDVYLPKNLAGGTKVATIINQTRYYRRIRFKGPMNWFMQQIDRQMRMYRRFIHSGYAFVRIDVRGSGASFGTRSREWSPEEVEDSAQIVDWIVKQPWSNGVVGAAGVSYDGTAAELLLTNQHPAVKAAILMFSSFDIFADIFAPGGIKLDYFIRKWSQFNEILDKGLFSDFVRKEINPTLSFFVKGVAPVDNDRDVSQLAAAIQEHFHNYDIYETSKEIKYRDDQSASGISINHFSSHTFANSIQASGVPIYTWSGWFDGGYPMAAIKRFQNIKVPGAKLILGPWDHGGFYKPHPPVGKCLPEFDLVGEMLRFFDYHLLGLETGIEKEKPIHYFTMGAETWNATDVWPPEGFETVKFYLNSCKTLTRKTSSDQGLDQYQVDYSAGTGLRSRWASLVNVTQDKIGYPDREERDRKLLVYESAPFERGIEVTGHPLISLYMRSSEPDGQIFLYLEECTASGEVHYVTEGLLRLIHRKIGNDKLPYEFPYPQPSYLREDAEPMIPNETTRIELSMIPVSYLFRKGSRIRIAIAGADVDNFELVPSTPPKWEILWGTEQESYIEIPIRMR